MGRPIEAAAVLKSPSRSLCHGDENRRGDEPTGLGEAEGVPGRMIPGVQLG